MGQLVALSQCVLFTPGIQVSKNPLTTPVTEHDHQAERDHHNERNRKEHAGIHAAQKQDAHRDDRDHHKSAHVGLGKKQQTHHGNRNSHRHHRPKKALFDVHLAHHVISGVQQYGKLGQLGWLKIHEAKRDPPARTIDAFADERHQHQNQQNQGCDEQPRRQLFPRAHGHLKSQQGHDKSHHQRQHMPH